MDPHKVKDVIELGRHRGRQGKSECALCGAEGECSAYSNIRVIFVEKLQTF